jgi:hypothetical protein
MVCLASDPFAFSIFVVLSILKICVFHQISAISILHLRLFIRNGQLESLTDCSASSPWSSYERRLCPSGAFPPNTQVEDGRKDTSEDEQMDLMYIVQA